MYWQWVVSCHDCVKYEQYILLEKWEEVLWQASNSCLNPPVPLSILAQDSISPVAGEASKATVAHILSPDNPVSCLMQGLEVDVPGLVIVFCTNTGKFVGAEGQWGPRNRVCPVESSILPISAQTHSTSVHSCSPSPPHGWPQGGKFVQTSAGHIYKPLLHHGCAPA